MCLWNSLARGPRRKYTNMVNPVESSISLGLCGYSIWSCWILEEMNFIYLSRGRLKSRGTQNREDINKGKSTKIHGFQHSVQRVLPKPLVLSVLGRLFWTFSWTFPHSNIEAAFFFKLYVGFFLLHKIRSFCFEGLFPNWNAITVLEFGQGPVLVPLPP